MDDRKKSILNRLARIEGHTRRIYSMVENDRDSSEILVQLAAVKSALNGVGREIMKGYIRDTIDEAIEKDDLEMAKQIDKMLDSFMK